MALIFDFVKPAYKKYTRNMGNVDINGVFSTSSSRLGILMISIKNNHYNVIFGHKGSFAWTITLSVWELDSGNWLAPSAQNK